MSKKPNLKDNKLQDEIINLKNNIKFKFSKFSGQLEKTSQIKKAKNNSKN